MGRAWANTLKACERTEIGGWVDINRQQAESSAEALELSDIHIDDDLGRALDAVKPDFVVDVTVPAAHHDVVLQALTAGYPVLGEKPLAASMAEAREMVEASQKTGKLYMVSQNRRFNPQIRSFKNLVGLIGDVGILNSDFYIGAHFGGFRDEMDHVLIEDMAIHTFDQARFISGADAIAVYCEEFNPSWSWYKGDASATAVFEMTGGLRYTYRGSWCSEGRHTSWEGDWRAVGAKGTATWDGGDIILADIVKEPDGFFSKTETLTGSVDDDPYKSTHGSLRDFLKALETGEPPMCDCRDNIKSLAMVFAAIESASTRQRVLLSDI